MEGGPLILKRRRFSYQIPSTKELPLKARDMLHGEAIKSSLKDRNCHAPSLRV